MAERSGLTREAYALDQQDAARQRGTTLGKRAVRMFVKACAERYSAGALGADEWNSGHPEIQAQMLHNLFIKYLAEIPPYGSPQYNVPVLTLAWVGGKPSVIANVFMDCMADFVQHEQIYRTAEKVFRLLRRRAGRVVLRLKLRELFRRGDGKSPAAGDH